MELFGLPPSHGGERRCIMVLKFFFIEITVNIIVKKDRH